MRDVLRMNYLFSRNRVSYITKHFFQWSFDKPDDFLPEKTLFEKLDHPADLHYLASIYNWDDDPVVLEWILESPLCTRSTANLIFWRAAPDYYLRYSLDDPTACPDGDKRVLSILRKIVAKYAAGQFSAFQIKFDPADEMETIMTAQPKWSFPAGVYDRIEGAELLMKPWWRFW